MECGAAVALATGITATEKNTIQLKETFAMGLRLTAVDHGSIGIDAHCVPPRTANDERLRQLQRTITRAPSAVVLKTSRICSFSIRIQPDDAAWPMLHG